MLRTSPRISMLIGIFVLAIVVAFLFSGPDYFSSNISFLDHELSKSSDSGQSVRVKMDLGHQEELESFPYQIGKWYGINEDIGGLKEQLGAETIIKRVYRSDNTFKPVFLLLMQSPSRASFHPPPVCYAALGYDIEIDTVDTVHVTDTSWISKLFNRDLEDMPGWMQEDQKISAEHGDISVKKLVVNDEDQSDRRVVFYVYIKDKKITSNSISMLRVSTLIPLSGSYEEESEEARKFMGEVIPLLFEPSQANDTTFLTAILDMGTGGYFLVVLMCALPIGLIVTAIVLVSRAHNW